MYNSLKNILNDLSCMFFRIFNLINGWSLKSFNIKYSFNTKKYKSDQISSDELKIFLTLLMKPINFSLTPFWLYLYLNYVLHFGCGLSPSPQHEIISWGHPSQSSVHVHAMIFNSLSSTQQNSLREINWSWIPLIRCFKSWNILSWFIDPNWRLRKSSGVFLRCYKNWCELFTYSFSAQCGTFFVLMWSLYCFFFGESCSCGTD